MLRRMGLLWNVYAGLALLISLTAIAVGILAQSRIVQASVKHIELALEQQAVFLRELAQPALLGYQPLSELQRTIVMLATRNDTRFTVIDAEGVVLADSHENPEQMENHLARPEVLEAGRDASSTVIRFSQTVGLDMMYFALPVKDESQLIGYVRTALPLSTVDSELAALRWYLAFGVGIALLFSLPAGWFFAQRIVQPLLTMEQAATRVAQGEYGHLVRIQRTDEIGQLANALNLLSASMSERIETITRDRNQLEAMLGSMAEGIIAADRNERIVHMNSVAANFCRTTVAGFTGKRTWEVIRLPQITDGIRQSISTGRSVFAELTIAGSPRDQHIDMEITPWRDSADAVVGAVVVLHDVTRIKSLEVMRREFVANASHELKSPVTAIRGLAETILDDSEMDVETRGRFIKGIKVESIRLSTLLQDLLTISRLEQGDGRGEETDLIDLREVIAEAVRQFQLRADSLGIGLESHCPAEAVDVAGRRYSLEAAVGNLISNGLNYTPEGGSVTVRLEVQDGQARISVADTGIGIAPEHHERIFERFYRVDKARSRDLGGTGLGLSIVKHTALSHGGSVKVASAPGQGSVFEVVLPLAGSSSADAGF